MRTIASGAPFSMAADHVDEGTLHRDIDRAGRSLQDHSRTRRRSYPVDGDALRSKETFFFWGVTSGKN